MNEENNQIFREKSLKRIASPEGLDQYIRTTTPSLWIILAAIIILLAGVIIWGYTGTIESAVDTGFVVSNGEAIAYILEDDIDKLVDTTVARIGDESYLLESYTGPIAQDDESIDFLLHAASIDENADAWYYVFSFKVDLADGKYLGKVVFETISPIGLVIN